MSRTRSPSGGSRTRARRRSSPRRSPSPAALLAGLKGLLATRPGLPLRLIAEDEEIAGSLGMDVEAIRYLTFGGACAMAAAAGGGPPPSGAVPPPVGGPPR